ncbi:MULTISPECIES: hypothetical protein [Prochlorococcus]|uniref:Uncharacterized protein n=1 Tax=Prochlorococcus marinus (strain SARG / CCMP1375 / SS120) TaxID=167539 RepID=Q7VCZ8_PROMA|nr:MULTISPECIES: hypothetical protein [Prochlorococcus]AAP99636.1 Predicted protein [Prochlorococcus marinus subsp. marinus str. CCMP1375]KGG11092.1 hypothetical protein EV04_1165 [Prochlorococcus marinus str. LG]KGG21430.1 hypothetical protein EV08_0515 [Prochlorococcus marinus str. SS2]KGG23225.1 hypothetical protein EV09_1973 [Prochlorococcus marinus str. SS35]KGG33936.1 hypothetical protein EV10_0375 [Prochlorococcus marinus str. SS51]
MTEEDQPAQKHCGNKKKAMVAYGIIQLGSSTISALALVAIALSLCSIKKEAKLFNECVEGVSAKGRGSVESVHFCNGGSSNRYR